MSDKAKSLYDQYFTPERKREMALAYLSLCDDGYVPPSFIAKTVVEWVDGGDDITHRPALDPRDPSKS